LGHVLPVSSAALHSCCASSLTGRTPAGADVAQGTVSWGWYRSAGIAGAGALIAVLCSAAPAWRVSVRLLCMPTSPGTVRQPAASASVQLRAQQVNNMWAGATATACCLPCTTWRLLSDSGTHLLQLLARGATTGLGWATTGLPLRRCLRLRHEQRAKSCPTQPARSRAHERASRTQRAPRESPAFKPPAWGSAAGLKVVFRPTCSSLAACLENQGAIPVSCCPREA
jgi:hypothetical protein